MRLRLFPLLAIPAFLTPLLRASTEQYEIGNAALRRVWSVEDGHLKTVSIFNLLDGKKSVPTACDEFRLRISDGPDVGKNVRTFTAADFKVESVEQTEKDGISSLLFWLRNDSLKVEMSVTLAKNEFWLRKQLVLTALHPLVLERIEPEAISIPGAEQPYKIKGITANAPYQWKPGLGQPLYGKTDGTFWGVEFPAADNSVKGDAIVCGYLYGRKLDVGAIYVAHPSVMGVADDPAFVQDAFFKYIDRTRARPFHLQVQYNTWFDFGHDVNREKFAQSVKTIEAELVRKRGVPPVNAYVIDDGWEDTKASWASGVWPVNAKFDPNFASSIRTVAAADSSLGLWLSPGMNFGASSKVPDLIKNGYEMLPPGSSLAGPKYMGALERRMTELVNEGVTFFKLDGLFGNLYRRVFELRGSRYGIPEMPQLGAENFKPDDNRLNNHKYDELKTYYLAAGTERLVSLFDDLGKLNPHLYILISNGAYLSPWWLQHVDCVWMINAGDAASGADRNAQLVYRDSILYNISVKEHTQFPLNAIFNHEPKKISAKESPAEFRSYLYMALSRGTGFLELYLKPRQLDAREWDVLAEGLLWAHHTGRDFLRSRMHGGDPAKGKVYGFTGWTADSGYVSIHNPSDKPATYRFKLDRKFGLLPGSGPFVLTSPLPGSLDGLKTNYSFGKTIELSLAPLQVKILNFDKTAAD